MIHALTAMWAYDKAKKREALSRRCLKCRSEQVAAERQINEPITCEKCGTLIPPRAAGSEAKGREQNG